MQIKVLRLQLGDDLQGSLVAAFAALAAGGAQAVLPGWAFARVPDAETGFLELVARRADS